MAFLEPWNPKRFEYKAIDLGFKDKYEFDTEWLPKNQRFKFPSYKWIKLTGIRYKQAANVS